MTLEEAYRKLGVKAEDDLQTIENAYNDKRFTIAIEPYEPLTPEEIAELNEAWNLICSKKK